MPRLMVLALFFFMVPLARAQQAPVTTYSATFEVVAPTMTGTARTAIMRDLSDAALVAAHEKLGMTAEEADAAQNISAQSSKTGFTVRITIDLPIESPKIAKRKAYFEAVGAKLSELLERPARQALDDLLIPREMTVRKLREQTEALAAETRTLRAVLRKTTGRLDTSPEGLRAAIASLDQENQKLSLDGSGMAVRRKMLEEAISTLAERAARTAKEDPVVEQLEALVTARENELKRLREMYKQGVVPAAEVGTAEGNLGEARVRLLERRSGATRSVAGNDTLADFNHELLSLTINLAENQARRDYITKALDRMSPAVEQIDQLESLIAARARIAQSLAAAETQLDEAQRQVSSTRTPQVLPPVYKP